MAEKGFAEATGTVIAGLAGLLGDKPRVPRAPSVDPQREQETAIQGNLDILPQLQDLAAQWNRFSTEDLMKNLEIALPGYGRMLREGSDKIMSFLRGEIPKDVSDQVSRRSAERATAGGYAGSPAGDALEARDLGLTSLSVIGQGLSAAERWMAQAQSRTPQYNFASMFITPQQQVAYEQWNEVQRFNTQWLRNQIKAMPSAMDQALTGALEGFGSIIDMAGSVYTGGMMGGGGGAGGPGLGPSGMGGMGGASGPRFGSTYSGYGGQNFMSVPNQQGGGYSMPMG